jgi:hypothetical protein
MLKTGDRGLCSQKGEEDMTKAKARLRAKANLARKAKKRKSAAGKPEQNFPPGRFDPGTSSLKSPNMNTNAKTLGKARMGAARSG